RGPLLLRALPVLPGLLAHDRVLAIDVDAEVLPQIAQERRDVGAADPRAHGIAARRLADGIGLGPRVARVETPDDEAAIAQELAPEPVGRHAQVRALDVLGRDPDVLRELLHD